jgi:hypothetical protein
MGIAAGDALTSQGGPRHNGREVIPGRETMCRGVYGVGVLSPRQRRYPPPLIHS